MANLGLKDRTPFANECLQPALDAGLIEMTLGQVRPGCNRL